VVAALSVDGATKWRLELPDDVSVADVAAARPWLALGTRSGQVYVVDTVRGERFSAWSRPRVRQKSPGPATHLCSWLLPARR
jgi:hypothetical protein